MQTLLVEIDSPAKAVELSTMLSSMSFVKKVSYIQKTDELLEALQEQKEIKEAIVKKKNKAIGKYL